MENGWRKWEFLRVCSFWCGSWNSYLENTEKVSNDWHSIYEKQEQLVCTEYQYIRIEALDSLHNSISKRGMKGQKQRRKNGLAKNRIQIERIFEIVPISFFLFAFCFDLSINGSLSYSNRCYSFSPLSSE